MNLKREELKKKIFFILYFMRNKTNKEKEKCKKL